MQELHSLKTSVFFTLIVYINFLGQNINGKGVSPNCSKVTAIQELPRPRNVKEVRQFLWDDQST